ncbi:hypothetical protein POX_e07250 [Penicillium oxalicum]|uniref:hypothetical protein n=1 Tax=Penicillium oxalicum TaxID=69781 RepID=UPI0020B75811|nr:hypothetical protein POX_e07250 [Penicillium oxalicum]KAI2789220.1 hypothetical protein POX_e07250 [Penicillium oxalicum]
MERSGAEVRPGQTSPVPTGPFGYAFLSPMDTPFEQPPALPPGLPLLDDNESSMLDNFFSTMNTNNLANDMWFRGHPDKPSGLDFDWNQELPPTFEGSTTSLSQSSYPPQSLKNTMASGGNPHTDVYAAASMLYPNETNRNNFGPALVQQNFTGQPLNVGVGHGRRESRHMAPAVASNSSPPRSRIPTGFHTSEMLFDVRDPIPVDQHPSRKARGLHWGSDCSFMDQGYVAPPDQPDMETRTREMLDHLDCFEPQDSAATTRAPSPERAARSHNSSAVHPQSDDENDSQPRKRQRTAKPKSGSPSDGEDPRSHANKSRSSSIAKGRRASTDTSRKARVAQASKAPRENLSEEQKRTNHILSEQKRRNLIRQGFDDLCSLVPSLRGGGFSKSAMLTQAADWLEDLLRGNELLQSQLTDMKTINGLVMPR